MNWIKRRKEFLKQFANTQSDTDPVWRMTGASTGIALEAIGFALRNPERVVKIGNRKNIADHSNPNVTKFFDHDSSYGAQIALFRTVQDKVQDLKLDGFTFNFSQKSFFFSLEDKT
jgi:hypothetical protein